MTDGDAIAEARERFGPHGAISLDPDWQRSRCLVGVLLQGPRFVVLGRGSSWSAAFADADARVVHASRRQRSLPPGRDRMASLLRRMEERAGGVDSPSP